MPFPRTVEFFDCPEACPDDQPGPYGSSSSSLSSLSSISSVSSVSSVSSMVSEGSDSGSLTGFDCLCPGGTPDPDTLFVAIRYIPGPIDPETGHPDPVTIVLTWHATPNDPDGQTGYWSGTGVGGYGCTLEFKYRCDATRSDTKQYWFTCDGTFNYGSGWRDTENFSTSSNCEPFLHGWGDGGQPVILCCGEDAGDFNFTVTE